jgi:hypothetical protein
MRIASTCPPTSARNRSSVCSKLPTSFLEGTWRSRRAPRADDHRDPPYLGFLFIQIGITPEYPWIYIGCQAATAPSLEAIFVSTPLTGPAYRSSVNCAGPPKGDFCRKTSYSDRRQFASQPRTGHYNMNRIFERNYRWLIGLPQKNWTMNRC